LVLLVLVLFAGIAAARPGGGESFSGGGGHSSGGGGGGGGGGGQGVAQLIYWIFQLCIYYPQIGLPILAIVIGFFIYSAYKQNKNKDWDSGPPVMLRQAKTLEPLRRVDPDFSQILFEDFVNRLYSEAQRKRYTPDKLATVAPYVSEPARQQLAGRAPGVEVQSVVVGALRAVDMNIPPAPIGENGLPLRQRIEVEIEANVTTKEHTYYNVETWGFERDANRPSKPPGSSKGFPCPNCGAPWQASQTGTQVCASCGQTVDNGRFDWTVADIRLDSADERGPTLTNDVAERGTDLQTMRSGDVDGLWRSLRTDDPALTETNLVARLHLIYDRLNKAWSENELEPVRGLVSDGLFDYLTYWTDAYKAQKLRNQLDDMAVTQTAVAKIVRDKWYDAVTIRLWARGLDYVVNTETGKQVKGSKSFRREYSEYWTLVRAHGRKGAPVAEPNCSNCGAPLKISMAGACEHCGAHVTAGEFDWILSKIEQDDTYRG
jgi:hypothetical protein